MQMDRKFAYYIFLGMVIGAAFGVFWADKGDVSLGILYGAFTGAAIGWFIAAARSQSQNEKDKTGKQ
jgi:hypothetical protein